MILPIMIGAVVLLTALFGVTLWLMPTSRDSLAEAPTAPSGGERKD